MTKQIRIFFFFFAIVEMEMVCEFHLSPSSPPSLIILTNGRGSFNFLQAMKRKEHRLDMLPKHLTKAKMKEIRFQGKGKEGIYD